jgi:hypothetical protein
MLTKPQRIYLYNYRVYLTYKAKYSEYHNAYDNKDWHGWEESAIFIGFHNRMCEFMRTYYGGHTSISLTILGITVGKINAHKYEHKETDEV